MHINDKVCDICGKKRGRPNDHTLCAEKRKIKYAAQKRTQHSTNKNSYTEANINGFLKVIDGTYFD